MTERTVESVDNRGYHAHIYYDVATTRAAAERLCAGLDGSFRVEIAGFRDTPRGPHPTSNVLVIFKDAEFERVVPWLMLHRGDLDVLIHPLTEDAVLDHSDYAIWLGNPVTLKLDTLSHRRGGQLPAA
jgi:DOPA 4,5-dioxygenase